MDWMHVLLLALLALSLAGCGVLGALLRRTRRRAQLLRDALSEAGEGNLCRLISATGTARERRALRALNEGLVQRNARRQRARRASAPVRPERCDLCALTREALDACRPLLEGSGLVLDARLPEEPVFATADPAALTRALSLLLQAVALHPGARGARVQVLLWRGVPSVRVEDDGAGDMPDLAEVRALLDRQRAALDAQASREGARFTVTLAA